MTNVEQIKIKTPRVASRGIKFSKGVEFYCEKNTVIFRLQEKEVRRCVPEYMDIVREDDCFRLSLNIDSNDFLKKKEQRTRRSQLGTYTSLLQADMNGLSTPFVKCLELVGVGYKAESHGDGIKLSVGYSHDVLYALPSGVTLTIEKPTLFNLSSENKELLGRTVSAILKIRRIEPYKGKGIRIRGQYIRMKQGKKTK